MTESHELSAADEERIKRFYERLAAETAESARRNEISLDALEAFDQVPKGTQPRILHVTAIKVMFALEQTPGVKRHLAD